MKSRKIILFAFPLLLLVILYMVGPAGAVTDGALRKSLEANHFGEWMIKAALYAKSSHDVYHPQKRKFVHGLPRITLPIVYEPDTLTWNLAWEAYHQKIPQIALIPEPLPQYAQPVPMTPGAVYPPSPDQVQLTPLGTNYPVARNSTDSPQRVEAIKQRLLGHMNSLSAPGGGAFGKGPNVPVLPKRARGHAGFSYDNSYDRE
ncbi:hypothetical protein HYY75_07880 [bacterium]|nr:hypothetical protein [bacterium]